MNVFILSTGRCGSTTFARACMHITNYTVGHESRARLVGPTRLDYPSDHIEADNRLSWFLGGLENRFGDRALYVHLTRDPEEVAASYNRRWHLTHTIVRGFKDQVLLGGASSPLDLCRFYVETTTQNIEGFLKGKPDVVRVRLESITTDFGAFWDRIGAHGDRSKALAEWNRRYNSGRSRARREKLAPLRALKNI